MQRIAGEPEALLVKQALEDVLAGSSFRSSRQCQLLLRYIVENSLARRYEMLRERVIGMNVFGRAADYDTGNDPVVRSRAAEVRKRLAQHYVRNDDAQGAIRIEIPSGSYRAVFQTVERRGADSLIKLSGEPVGLKDFRGEEMVGDSADHTGETSLPEKDSAIESVINSPKARRNWPKWTAGVALATVLLFGAGFVMRREQPPNQRTFWLPVTNTQHPVLIYIGANHSYLLKKDFLDKYRAEHHLENTGQEFFIDLKKGTRIDESDLMPINMWIGFGDVAAVARMTSMLTRFKKRYDLRYGNDIAVTDFQSSPAILIGGFSNMWTLEVMHQLRFRLERGDRIVDEKYTNRVWVRKSDPETFTGDDYAVISRLERSETGNFILAIAGIDTYSNQAAADFLNDPDRLGAFLGTLPQGWEKKNMQVVLHTSVVKEVPAAANVEAVELW